ncbi:MAG: hypothetical protein A4E52_00003 [Pelotomaculum sp. PtaB.Bin013]|uniref:Aspartyl-phosphate phosphatase Spo0E family protein n=1 Tax=Pelotomaculum isophthalicicum JI TaxID=947010 RepID=A0A9X4H7R8_9FIRM|nr:aspartyl-phosphate phosphatase Spo0E family protein [Pelotomaculum isophthalicicum]MDF9409974.1 aspartyl-phosphate phosphatase Spo0E family protein [Pelotomaculum isophthalicicum JI]OPX92238.1 MAG: hypothetical protein A4E52_00003 [Pelotomaculum sp. PtaB.Bin013]
MSRMELLTEIERLRAEMHGLYVAGVGYDKVLEINQRLDRLIVKLIRISLVRAL